MKKFLFVFLLSFIAFVGCAKDENDTCDITGSYVSCDNENHLLDITSNSMKSTIIIFDDTSVSSIGYQLEDCEFITFSGMTEGISFTDSTLLIGINQWCKIQ